MTGAQSDTLKNHPLQLDITSAVLLQPDCGWLKDAQKLLAQYNGQLGIQMHNTSSPELLDKAVSTKLPLSLHAPVFDKYQLNLAAANADISWAILDHQYDIMKKHNINRAVFHGFLMTDQAIEAFGHGKDWYECMNRARRPELLRAADSNFVCNFTQSAEFIARRNILKNNLQLLTEKYPDICWCIENDYPGVVSGLLRGEDMQAIEHELCFDTGHMWITCKMLDLNMYEELNTALSSGMVQMVHFHNSPYTFDMPHEQWSDGHQPLNTPGAMDLKRIAQTCKQSGVWHFVLEIGNASLADVEIFLQYYFEE